MKKYELLAADEEIVYETKGTCNFYKGEVEFALTTARIIFKQKRGLFIKK